MHAGVRAARSCYVDGAPLDLAEHLLEPALNGGEPRLHLPAVKIGSVVRDSQFDAPHVACGRIRCGAIRASPPECPARTADNFRADKNPPRAPPMPRAERQGPLFLRCGR